MAYCFIDGEPHERCPFAAHPRPVSWDAPEIQRTGIRRSLGRLRQNDFHYFISGIYKDDRGREICSAMAEIRGGIMMHVVESEDFLSKVKDAKEAEITMIYYEGDNFYKDMHIISGLTVRDF